MKKIMIIAALACSAWATDFSHMSTEQLMNMRGKVSTDECPSFHQEMQKRMQNMDPMQRRYYRNNGGGMGMMSFRDFDTNNNGYITPREFKIGQEKCIMRMQKTCGFDNRGLIMGMKKHMMTFRDFDINHNGYITKWEFQKGHQKCIARKYNNIGGTMQGNMMGNGVMRNGGMMR